MDKLKSKNREVIYVFKTLSDELYGDDREYFHQVFLTKGDPDYNFKYNNLILFLTFA